LRFEKYPGYHEYELYKQIMAHKWCRRRCKLPHKYLDLLKIWAKSFKT